MRIGELALRTGTTTKTIRYYEDIGVLPEPDRAPNDYRDYAEEAVVRLSFVRDAQATGLTLTEIASILDLRSRGETTCHHVVELVDRHLEALDKRIRALRQTRRKLAELTQRARGLEPVDCVDPNRCQTITTAGLHDGSSRDAGRHLHDAPVAHRL
jgi:DNA-binding transcriptional MerR regulator